jgi:hypothetical protein
LLSVRYDLRAQNSGWRVLTMWWARVMVGTRTVSYDRHMMRHC